MKTCTQCGTPIAGDSPEGLCARCLLSGAMGSEGAGSVGPIGPVVDQSLDPMATQDAPAGPGPGGSSAVANINIADAAEVARRLPHFEILQLLGRGGMGVVYKARQTQLDRIVALKILPPADAMSPGFIERFRREARSLAKLGHPNIVSVYDFGQSNGLFYFVMEYVDGLNLRQMIQAHQMSPAEALAIVPKICDALQFAHDEGVVHRDVKPENILIDKRGRVKIADFGLAKLLGRDETDPRLTMTGAALGTPRYMAPEQVDKPDSVDHRADIYSLGVVFYEMLTGELPMGRFAPPSHKAQVDVRLDEIVLHALERDVERRYQNVSEVGTDVEEVTRKPESALPPPVAAYARPTPSLVNRTRPLFAPAVRFHLAAFGAFALCWLLTGAMWNLGPWAELGAGVLMTIVVGVFCRRMQKARPELLAARARTSIGWTIRTGDFLKPFVFLAGFCCLMIGVVSSWDALRAPSDSIESAGLFENAKLGEADQNLIKLFQGGSATLSGVTGISVRDLTLETRRAFTPESCTRDNYQSVLRFGPNYPAPIFSANSLHPWPGEYPAAPGGRIERKAILWPVAFPPQFLHGTPILYNCPMMLGLGIFMVLATVGGWNKARGYKYSWKLVWRPGLGLGLMVPLSLAIVYFSLLVTGGIAPGSAIHWGGPSMSWNGPGDLLVAQADRWAGDHEYVIAAQTVADVKDSRGYAPIDTFVVYKALSLWDPNPFHRWHMTWTGLRLTRPEILLLEVSDAHNTCLEYFMPQTLTNDEYTTLTPFLATVNNYIEPFGKAQHRFDTIGAEAKAALAAGHLDKSAALANGWLTMVPDFMDGWDYGNALHDGNEILGLIALKKNDVAEAKSRLLAAGKMPGSPEMNASGPDFALADALLARGESPTVLAYLQDIQTMQTIGGIWRSGGRRVDDAVAAIRAGKTPTLATTRPTATGKASTLP